MPIHHTVAQGECLSRIAGRYGHPDCTKVWEHPDNARLRDRRKSPDLLFPGDVVVVPDLRLRSLSCKTDTRHVFRAVIGKRWLRIVLEDEDGHRLANRRYVLDFQGQVLDGVTDGDGLLEKAIPSDAERGRLLVADLEWSIHVAHLNPAEAGTPDLGVSGAQGRLRNLGYDTGPIDGELGRRTRMALRFFQADEQLAQTGEFDNDTRRKLLEVHGC